MFIALIRFPEVPVDRDADFQAWFAWSNRELAGADGLRSRRLLRTAEGQYAGLVEYESLASFAAMHAAPVVTQIQARLHEIVPVPPQATEFEVLSEPNTGGCCGDAGTDHHHAFETGEAAAAGCGCCHAD